MLLMEIDERSEVPKFRQIMEGIRERIGNSTLRPGDRLPSTRRLADTLGIHRSTVTLAYQELWSLGLLDIRPGARPRVRERKQLATPAVRKERGCINWEEIASEAGEDVLSAYLLNYGTPEPAGASTAIDFRSLDQDRRLFPLENFRSCLTRVARRGGDALLAYGEHAGYPPLRETIARRMRTHSINVDAEEVLITNGAQQGIDLVFRMVAAPGRAVAFETPSYGHMLPLLGLHGLRPIEITMRRGGMDLDALESTLRREKPVLLYTMPTFHNPTGISTDQAHRERLLAICERHRVPILEDAFDEEMKYFGKVVLPIKSMDARNVVIYCGTFSKVLFPGIRIGWVAAERECIRRLTAIRCFSDISSNTMLQAAIDEFCRNGYYDRHVNRMHRVFRKRMQAAIRALREHIRPRWAEWDEPSGGYLIWLKLKPSANQQEDWYSHLASHGVLAVPGNRFFFGDPGANYLRLSISTLDEEEIAEGIRRLARALAEAFTGDT